MRVVTPRDLAKGIREPMSLRKATLFLLFAALARLASSAWAQDVCQSVAKNLIVNCGFETGDLSGWTLSGNTALMSDRTWSLLGSSHTRSFPATCLAPRRSPAV